MSKVTGAMILQALKSNNEASVARMQAFEKQMDLKFHGLERAIDIRLDAQKEKITALDTMIATIEIKVGDMSKHIGFIRVICDIARFIHPKAKG